MFIGGNRQRLMTTLYRVYLNNWTYTLCRNTLPDNIKSIKVGDITFMIMFA